MVWPPNGGKPEEHYRFNAVDLVRHAGWSYSDPAQRTAREVKIKQLIDGDEKLPQGYTQLDVWRKQAQDLGVRVDPSWGIRKLQHEIEQVKRASRSQFDIKVDPEPTPASKDVEINAGRVDPEVALMQRLAAQAAAEDAADGFGDTTSPAAVEPAAVVAGVEEIVAPERFSDKPAAGLDPVAKLNAHRKGNR